MTLLTPPPLRCNGPRHRAVSALLLSLAALWACGGTSREPAVPNLTQSPDAPPASARDNRLPPAPSAVPRAPADCALHGGALEPLDVEACPGPGPSFRQALVAALTLDEPRRRDKALLALEACPRDAAAIRALRAELAPEGCADVLVEPWLAAWDDPARDPELHSALAGLALAARLHRLVREPPNLTPPFDEAAFREFLETTLSAWILEQAHAIHQTALLGAKLPGYGKGIVAVSAGLADLRFVDVVREIPLPESLAADPELRDEYQLALEQSLEARVVRGRDAALVGLRKFADEGILVDERLSRARAMLSRLFSGHRIDALDGLVFPPLPELDESSPELWLAAHLPTFYASRWLADLAPSAPSALRALHERGFPPAFLAEAESHALSPDALHLVARAHTALGQTYWRTESFDRASAVAARIPSASPMQPEGALIRAVAAALRGGPKDAAHMMLRGPFLPSSVGDVSALDALAARDSSVAPYAAFDAALLLALIPEATPTTEYWTDIARRFEHAAAQAPTASLAAEAAARAGAALATAQALQDRAEAPQEAAPPSSGPAAASDTAAPTP